MGRPRTEYGNAGEHKGYWRPDHRHPWRELCRSETWRETWLALSIRVRGLADDPDLLVLESNQDPNTATGGKSDGT
jgi:hypothetical protein